MKPSPRRRPLNRHSSGAEHGYILITLLLFVALLAIAMIAMAPEITRQIKRDREDELIHRGVQYSRAIQHYVKKFGRYPTRIEELEDTNNLRFLRKRYKDPITGKDFKILHMGDVPMAFGGGLAGGTLVSVVPAGAGGNPTGGFGSSTVAGSNGGFGSSSFGGNNGAFGGGNSGFGNNGFGTLGGSSSTFGQAPGSSSAPASGAPAPGTDATQTSAGLTPDQSAAGGTGTQAVAGQPGSAPGACRPGSAIRHRGPFPLQFAPAAKTT